jgi:hypothetical protein
VAKEVPPRDPARLVELDDCVHNLVRHDQTHVHPEASPEAEPLRATGLGIPNRPRTVDDRMLRWIGEDVEDAVRISVDHPFHGDD